MDKCGKRRERKCNRIESMYEEFLEKNAICEYYMCN